MQFSIQDIDSVKTKDTEMMGKSSVKLESASVGSIRRMTSVSPPGPPWATGSKDWQVASLQVFFFFSKQAVK